MLFLLNMPFSPLRPSSLTLHFCPHSGLPLLSGAFEITVPVLYLDRDFLSSLFRLMEALFIFFPRTASLYVPDSRMSLVVQNHHNHHPHFLFSAHRMLFLETAKPGVPSSFTHAGGGGRGREEEGLPAYWLNIPFYPFQPLPRESQSNNACKGHLSLLHLMLSWNKLSCLCET